MTRPKVWSEEVEEAYRFQLAGYRDEKEYTSVKKIEVRHNSLSLEFKHKPSNPRNYIVQAQKPPDISKKFHVAYCNKIIILEI